MNQVMRVIFASIIITGIETIVKMDMNIMKVIIGKELAAVTVAVAAVAVIILEELMSLLLHRRIHQHIHQRNIVLVLLSFLAIIVSATVVTVVAVLIIEALIHQHIHRQNIVLVLLVHIIIVTPKFVTNRKVILGTKLTNVMIHLIIF